MEKGHTESPETMKAQHDRMADFKEAAGVLSDAIIHNSPKLAQEGAEILDRSLEGPDRDFPQKNRSHVKEFHRLYVELGKKRMEKLKSAIRADDLPRSAARARTSRRQRASTLSVDSSAAASSVPSSPGCFLSLLSP